MPTAAPDRNMSLRATLGALAGFKLSFLPLRLRARLLGGRYVPVATRVDRMSAALWEVLEHVDAAHPAGQAALRGLNATNAVDYP